MHSHRYQISSSICFQFPKKTADVWSRLPTKRISSPSGQGDPPIKLAQRAKLFYSFKFFLDHQFPHKAFTLFCPLCLPFWWISALFTANRKHTQYPVNLKMTQSRILMYRITSCYTKCEVLKKMYKIFKKTPCILYKDKNRKKILALIVTSTIKLIF